MLENTMREIKKKPQTVMERNTNTNVPAVKERETNQDLRSWNTWNILLALLLTSLDDEFLGLSLPSKGGKLVGFTGQDTTYLITKT